MQHVEEETFGRLGIAYRALEKLQRVPSRIDRPVEVHPHFLNFEVRFIYTPGVVARFQMSPTTLFQLRSIGLHPAKDGGMIHMHPSFPHHFLQITLVERVTHVSAHVQQDDLGFEMAPFERIGMAHERKSSALTQNKVAFIREPLFLQSNWFL